MNDQAVVFVVDSDRESRVLVRAIAESINVLCEEFLTAEDFLQVDRTNRPACLVTELQLVGMGGVALQEALARRRNPLPMIFVTAYAEVPLVVRVMQNGAINLFEKPPSRQQLRDAIRQGIATDARNWRLDVEHQEIGRRLARITPKERAVMDGIVAGRSNKVIANELQVSIRTVEAYRHRVFDKTQTKSVAELVQTVLRFDSAWRDHPAGNDDLMK